MKIDRGSFLFAFSSVAADGDGVRCGVHSHAQDVRGDAQDVLK